MAHEFKSWLSYWAFVRDIEARRYVHVDEGKEFLAAVLETGRKRRETVPAGGHLWRAQPGHKEESGDDVTGDRTWGLDADKMKPTIEYAFEGRTNPKGILHLYLATHRDTAMAEVARWSGPDVSVAQFKICRSLEVINFTMDERPSRIYGGCEPSAELREKYVWADINEAFSKPLARSDSSADYVPTQVITEVFKAEGFDGVAYRSSLGPCHPGHNLVLFDLDAVDFVGAFRLGSLRSSSNSIRWGKPSSAHGEIDS